MPAEYCIVRYTIFAIEQINFETMTLLAISGGHIAILAIALFLLFGVKKIPELMSGLGKGMKDFKKAVKDDDDTTIESPKEAPPASAKREPLKE